MESRKIPSRKRLASEQSEIEYLGFVQIPTVVLYDRRLSCIDKYLWCLLKRYARNADHCYPSLERLAQGMGITKRMVQEHLKVLEKNGLIKVDRKCGEHNEYLMIQPHVVYSKNNDGINLKDESLEDLKEAGEDWSVRAISERRCVNSVECRDNDGSVNEDCKEEVQKTVSNQIVSVPLPSWDVLQAKLEKNKQKHEEISARRGKRKTSRAMSEPEEKRNPSVDIPHGEARRGMLGEIEDAWIVAHGEKWPDKPGLCCRFTRTDWRIVKRLVADNGEEFVRDALYKIVLCWDDLAARFRLRGFPNMKLLAYHSAMWFTEIRAGAAYDPATGRSKAIESGEYRPSSDPDGGIFAFQKAQGSK